MNKGRLGKNVLIATALAAGIGLNARAAVSVLTYQYDNTRAGANTNETILTPANVNTNTFGKLFSYPVDGYVYGQPLIVPNVTIPGKGTHDILYITTENDSVYAFDADTYVSTPYWHTSFVNLPNTNSLISAVDTPAGPGPKQYGNNIKPAIGITCTPVIDPVTQTIFVEARTRVVNPGILTNYYHMLHALDITTGLERPNSPANIFATNYPGVGCGTNTNSVYYVLNVADTDGLGHVLWNSRIEQNRPGLTLVNGQVIITYAEPGDEVPYHGWMFAYNETNLTQTGVWCSTPNGASGGFWMGGGAPAVDTNGFIYANTGNGDFNAASNNYGDSYVKLSVTNGLQLVDYFSPSNQYYLESQDYDVSSAGMILLPDSAGSMAHQHLLFGGCKSGLTYLIDRDNLGQFNGVDQIVQEMALPGQIFSGPIYYNGWIYMVDEGDRVKAFSIADASINTTAVSVATATPTFASGTTPTLSANGTSNAILWAVNIDSFNSTNSYAILYALNATNLAQQLYSSSQLLARDKPGPAADFTSPTVANGKVYVNGNESVTVYGNAYFFPVNAGVYNNGVYTLPMSGTPNFTYTLQATTDFSTWTNVSSNTPSASPFNLIDTGASNYQRRFYRAVVP